MPKVSEQDELLPFTTGLVGLSRMPFRRYLRACADHPAPYESDLAPIALTSPMNGEVGNGYCGAYRTSNARSIKESALIMNHSMEQCTYLSRHINSLSHVGTSLSHDGSATASQSQPAASLPYWHAGERIVSENWASQARSSGGVLGSWLIRQ